jgi:hypothetical protein
MVNINNQTSLSDIQSIRFNGDLATVYPVPARDQLTVESAGPSLLGTTAVISDMQGKTVQQFVITQMKQVVSIATLPAGIYVLRLVHGETHRVVKQ